MEKSDQHTITSSNSSDDERFMRMALDEARKAALEGEVPVGAIVVTGRGNVIGRGHNMTEALADVTAHAEMMAITSAANALGAKYLAGCTLYVTVEPCTMCGGAIGWSQLSRIVYGAADTKRGYTTVTSRSPFHPRAVVTSGVLADECAALMREFFASRR